jgi:hypothetical protein
MWESYEFKIKMFKLNSMAGQNVNFYVTELDGITAAYYSYTLETVECVVINTTMKILFKL